MVLAAGWKDYGVGRSIDTSVRVGRYLWLLELGVEAATQGGNLAPPFA